MRPFVKDTLLGPRTKITVRTKLTDIAQRARADKNNSFCSLAHLMGRGTLREAFRRISNAAAPGIDGETKENYREQLEDNLTNLLDKLKRGTYKPLPVRRKYIPKAGSNKMRPLGIPALEDKLVQTALVIILESIYEQDFLDFSFGFRSKRNCHDALKDLSRNIGTKKIGYIVEADIRKFFDQVNHQWIMKMLEHRIKDTKILRLIKRFLKAGIMEEDTFTKTTEGVPQGGNLSPLLANIYLHYVLDLWFHKAFTKQSIGEAYLTRYADDFVACFQHKRDAQLFYQNLKDRIQKFGLEVAEEKTRLIEFGQFAERDRKRRGEGKPETFDFLGFTHYCGRSRKGRFKLKWKTARKRFNAKVNAFAQWIKENRHQPLKEMWKTINSKLRGHSQYYGVSDNWHSLLNYKRQIIILLGKWLNRRSQKSNLEWNKFNKMMKLFPLDNPKSLVNLNSAYV